MPRVYKKKGSKNKWNDEQLHEAVQKVKSHELSLRAAALSYGIPKSTLSDHVKGVSSKRYGGCSTVLTREEEQEIVLTCQVLAEMGFPLTTGYVEVVVRDYLKNNSRSSSFGPSGVPGRSWWEGFLCRWPALVQRKPQHLARQRAQCSIQGACTNCGAQLTPMRPHLTLHFQKLLQQKNASKGTKARKRVQSQYYGEALTSDEVMERMQEEKSTKGPSKKKRRQSPPEVEGFASSSRAANESEVESHDEGIYVYHFNERHT